MTALEAARCRARIAVEALNKAERDIVDARLAEKVKDDPPTWKNTLNSQRSLWGRSVSDAMNLAAKLSYPYFSWSGYIYHVEMFGERGCACKTEVLDL